MRFSAIFRVRSLKSLSEFLRCLLLISLKSEPLKIWFRHFARRSSLFFSLSAIAPKNMVRSRAKSDWAISKSDAPSSDFKASAETVSTILIRMYVLYILMRDKNGSQFAPHRHRTRDQSVLAHLSYILTLLSSCFFILHFSASTKGSKKPMYVHFEPYISRSTNETSLIKVIILQT